MYAAAGRGEISKKVVKEFSDATGNRKLPARVKHKASRHATETKRQHSDDK